MKCQKCGMKINKKAFLLFQKETKGVGTEAPAMCPDCHFDSQTVDKMETMLGVYFGPQTDELDTILGTSGLLGELHAKC